jgi:DNA-directed RNA polymerase specialized sigma24 family protein
MLKEQSDFVQVTLEELFNCHSVNLQYFASQFLNDTDTAKDIVQETFILYWTIKDTLSPKPKSVKSFLYSSTRNACLNNFDGKD